MRRGKCGHNCDTEKNTDFKRCTINERLIILYASNAFAFCIAAEKCRLEMLKDLFYSAIN